MSMARIRLGTHLKGLLGIAIGMLIIFPLFSAISYSVMPNDDIISYPPKIIPDVFTIEHYVSVFSAIPIVRFIWNSFFVSAVIICVQVLTSSLAAYGFVFFDFPLKNALFIAVLATMMIPGEATIISNYLTMSSARLLDSYLGLILPYCASAMAIFMIRQNYMTLPKELQEAAVIDGCGNTRFFFSILFPLSMPVVSALAVYTYIVTWNQFMWPLLITNTEQMRTVQIGISMLQFADGISYGVVCAGCCVVLVPTVLIFVVGQQKMVAGITAGSVKG